MNSVSRLFFYRPVASPLHAARAELAALWAAALVSSAILLDHPLALLALLVAVLLAGCGARVCAELSRALRAVAIVSVPIVLVNLLVSRNGLTVFARLGSLGPFGQGDLTLEALVYGAVIALKVAIVMLASTLASLAIDPDELLRRARRFSYRLALTAALTLRMIPLLAADAQRLAEAQRTRAVGASAGGRSRLAILSAMVAGSLDRAMDVAATLEVRGFASPGGRRALTGNGVRGRLRMPLLSRHDLAFAVSAVAAVALSAAAGHWAAFDAYPRVHAQYGVALAAFCATLVAVLVLPFCDRRGIAR